MTEELKRIIFAPYIGQKIANGGTLTGNNLDTRMSATNMRLLLKPLSSITDEDANEVARLQGYDCSDRNYSIDFSLSKYDSSLSCKVYVKNKMTHFIWSCVVSNTFQYLQSKGYALPYMQYSVDDLVKEGLYELIK